jgi:uncharacterized protein
MLETPIGPLRLLILQPTPFCNINCSYCYLADRSNKNRMTPASVSTAVRWAVQYLQPEEPFTLLWHSGEPLVCGLDYFQRAFDAVQMSANGARFEYAIQTNGILLNDNWCAFFKKHLVRVGVSLDGPADLHDANRVTRGGRGTHHAVMQGVRVLQANGIPTSVIAVVTRDTLEQPDRFFGFFLQNNLHNIAFNIEEQEGINTSTSMRGPEIRAKHERFLRRLYELNLLYPEVRIREFTTATRVLLGTSSPPSAQKVPFQILSIDYLGNLSTFSPELLDAKYGPYDSFHFGNVHHDSLESVVASAGFRRVYEDIRRGVEACRRECHYFSTCGSAIPGNKLFELGTFTGTETLHCVLTQKALQDVVLDYLLEGRAVLPVTALAPDRMPP